MTKKQILTSLKLTVVSLFGVGVLVGATSVQAVECSVLPSSICGASDSSNLEDSGIWKLLVLIIRIMTIGVGIVAVAALTYAGFLYTTAQDSSEQTKKAKTMIASTVIGLLLYALMWSLLQYLVPGGVFST